MSNNEFLDQIKKEAQIALENEYYNLRTPDESLRSEIRLILEECYSLMEFHASNLKGECRHKSVKYLKNYTVVGSASSQALAKLIMRLIQNSFQIQDRAELYALIGGNIYSEYIRNKVFINLNGGGKEIN